MLQNPFQNQYKKTYKTNTETLIAYENFMNNQRNVDEHNRLFDLDQVNFQLSLNRFADQPPGMLRNISTGFLSPTFAVTGRLTTIISPGTLPAGPPSWDWSARGFVTPVKDQGYYCNNCWAFSAIGALESHFMIKHGKRVVMSEQQLIDCNRNDLTGNFGCEGGNQASAYVYIMNMGIQTLDSYPYLEDVPHTNIYRCKYNYTNSVGKIKGHYRLRPKNETLLRDVVAAIGPVAFAFYGSLDSFSYYYDGIYDDPSCPR